MSSAHNCKDHTLKINLYNYFLMCFVEGGVAVILKLYKFSCPDLLTIEHHTPTPEPIRYEKTEGQWYGHDGVDVQETQARKGTLE